MSGLEVVGVLLGAFPLLISAIEHWREAIKAAGLAIHFDSEHRKSLNDVKDEQLKFRLNLELLLRPLVKDEALEAETLEALLEEPGGPCWHEEDVESALKAKLGESFDRCVETMQELGEAIWKMTQSLGPRIHEKLQEDDDARQGAQTTVSSVHLIVAKRQYLKAVTRYRVQQLKFSLNREGRKERMEEIRLINSKLGELLDLSDKVSKLQRPSTVTVSRKASKTLVQYWQHAGRIHALVKASWECPCKQRHCAHLWLHHPQSNDFELRLLVLWSRSTEQSNDLPPWDQQGISITWIQDKALQHKLGTMAAKTIIVAPPAALDEDSKPAKKRKNAVSFLSSHKIPEIRPRKTCEPAIASSSIIPPVASAHSQRIKDLCTIFTNCQMDPLPLGVLSGQGEDHVYSVCLEPDQKLKAMEISLREVLLMKCGRRLKKRSARVQVALDIASAHLRLHSTAWSRRQWEAKDILFPHDTRSGKIMFDKPYVSADFNETLPEDERKAKDTDRSFACLGIMLLELWFGLLLEEHEIWQRTGFEQNVADSTVRAMVAIQWADDLKDDAGPEFAAAVIWCLQESPTTLLEGTQGTPWRRDLAEKVVLRLQRCRDWMMMGSSL